MKAHYVVVLLFTSDLEQVLLVQKTHPAWQAGKFNGPGGGVDTLESHADAAARELEEETGIVANPADLFHFLRVTTENTGVVVDYLANFSALDTQEPQAMTDEMPTVVPVRDLPENLIEDLRWIIPMALAVGLESPVRITNYFRSEEKNA